VLDHNLVNGNALVGVGAIGEIKAKFEEAGTSLFPVDADNLLGQAERPLKRLANLSDATLADVAQARHAMEEARIAVGDTKALCDIITAQGLTLDVRYQFEKWESERSRIQKHPMRHKALTALEGLKAFHFPVAFPEVFLRRRAGFDVLLGNPPWQEATVEDHAFWARHFPGLRGMSSTEMERERDRLRKAHPDLAVELDKEVEEMVRVRRALTEVACSGCDFGDGPYPSAPTSLAPADLWLRFTVADFITGRPGADQGTRQMPLSLSSTLAARRVALRTAWLRHNWWQRRQILFQILNQDQRIAATLHGTEPPRFDFFVGLVALGPAEFRGLRNRECKWFHIGLASSLILRRHRKKGYDRFLVSRKRFLLGQQTSNVIIRRGADSLRRSKAARFPSSNRPSLAHRR